MGSKRDQMSNTDPFSRGNKVTPGLDMAALASKMAGGGKLDTATPPAQVDVPHGTAQLVIVDERTFQFGRVQLTPTELVLPDDLTEDEWFDIGYALLGIQSAIAWWLGDWLKDSDNRWQRSYAELAAQFEFEVQTAYDYASIARRVPRSVRRAELSFTHHRAVRALDTGDQEYWLDQAVIHQWSVADLRGAIKESRHGPDDPLTPLDEARRVLDRVHRSLVAQASTLAKHERQAIAAELENLARMIRET